MPGYQKPPANMPEWVAPQPLPDDPLQARLIDVSGWHVEMRCETCGRCVVYPLRRAAAEAGWSMALGDFIARLKCREDGTRPKTVRLMSNPLGDKCQGRPTDPNVQILVLEVAGRD
jgi:hypothetical protein